MRDLPQPLRAKKLTEITLPGSHDSGAFDFSAEVLDQYQTDLIKKVKAAVDVLRHIPSMVGVVAWITDTVLTKAVTDWGKAQNLDIGGQLQLGIRWFDLRTMMYQGAPYLYHGFVAHPVSNALDQVKAFIDDWPSEIVVLYFSHMGTLQDTDHVALADSIRTQFGLEHIWSSSDLTSQTVAQLQAGGKQLVVFYDAAFPSRSQYPWLLQQSDYYYKPDVEKNTTDALISAYDDVIAQYKGSLPFNVGLTTTPITVDVAWSIANQFNPFSKTHDLEWFTEEVRDALPNWMVGNPSTRLGVVSTDFVDETGLLALCLRHMGVPVAPPPPALVQSFGAITIDGGRPYAFASGTDGHLWVNWWDGNVFNWSDQGTPPRAVEIASPCGAITVNGGRPYVFSFGNDGHLWVNWWDGGNWNWSDQGVPSASVAIQSSMGATTVDGGRPYAYVLGTDGHLWVNWWDGGNWNWSDQGAPSTDVGIQASMGAITVDGTRPYVYALGTDGQLWSNWWDGASFHWSTQGVPSATVGIQSSMGAITVDGGRPYVYVLGTDGHLWVNWWDGSSFQWSDQGVPSASVAIHSSMGATTVDGGRPYAYVLGTDGHLWANWWDGCSFQWSDQGVPSASEGIQSSMGAITVDGGRPYVYVRATDGHLWVNWWDGNAFHWSDQGGGG
jgi:hypothetical protein